MKGEASEDTPDALIQGPGTPTHAPIRAGPKGDLVWRHLKATWLTHHFVSGEETHVKGGYTWDASSYLPVMTLDAEGQPALGFARTTD